MGEYSSEVARLRAQIEQECQAARRGMHGYACVARHDFIEKRMDQVSDCHQQLTELIGEHEAFQLLVDALDRACQAERTLKSSSFSPT